MTSAQIMPWLDMSEVETPAAPATADTFAMKVIYVICNASVTAHVGRNAYERCMRALKANSSARLGFRHPAKAEAIDRIWHERHELFETFERAEDRQAFLRTIPWIGDVGYHKLGYLLGFAETTETTASDNDKKRIHRMQKERASDVGFCVVDSNADFIADNLVRRIHENAQEMESEVNRLYRGRHAYELNTATKQDLEKAVERLKYMTKTLRDIRDAQEPENVVYLQAAE